MRAWIDQVRTRDEVIEAMERIEWYERFFKNPMTLQTPLEARYALLRWFLGEEGVERQVREDEYPEGGCPYYKLMNAPGWSGEQGQFQKG